MPPSPRITGVLGPLAVPLGLGLLRLSTDGRPEEPEAIAVIHHALNLGIRLLDTADVYCRDQTDLHYGERLVKTALDLWPGPRHEVRVLTKAGLSRPKGKWIPNGRPAHLRKAIDGSLAALGVERLFVVQLHAHDSSVPFEETLGALADLRREGKIEHVGLCNTTPGELQQAKRHFPVAIVQNELHIFARKSATDGLVVLTAQEGIPFLAYRPLGGIDKAARLAKDKILQSLATRHRATVQEVALAALLDVGPNVIPLVGATKATSVRSSVAAMQLKLDLNDRTALGAKYSFAPSPEALTLLAPPADVPLPTLKPNTGPGDAPEVVLLMGIQGAGKSRLVAEYVEHGYARLNRDVLGGKLDDLVPKLVELLKSGERRIVLDNTYATRLSRAPVIRAAHAHGIPVRCRFLKTPGTEARINVVLRMLEKYGRPLGPDEMKTFTKTDPNLPPPAALAKWESTFEPPALDEGFAAVDVVPFERIHDPAHTEKGLLLDVDGTLRKTKSGELYPRHPDDVELLPGRREVLERWVAAGYKLFFVSNQSGVASGQLGHDAAVAAFLRTAELLQLPIAEVAYCPHPAFPVGCFCRKPGPGLGVYLMRRHSLSPHHLVVVGDMTSDEQFANSIAATYFDATVFFSANGPSP
jgi:histidinol-phosphate phosphatase family protein